MSSPFISKMLDIPSLSDDDLLEMVDVSETNINLRNKKIKWLKIREFIESQAGGGGHVYYTSVAEMEQAVIDDTFTLEKQYVIESGPYVGIFKYVPEGATAGPTDTKYYNRIVVGTHAFVRVSTFHPNFRKGETHYFDTVVEANSWYSEYPYYYQTAQRREITNDTQIGTQRLKGDGTWEWVEEGGGETIITTQSGILIRWPISSGVQQGGKLVFTTASAVILRGPEGPLPALDTAVILGANLDGVPAWIEDGHYEINNATTLSITPDTGEMETLLALEFFYLNIVDDGVDGPTYVESLTFDLKVTGFTPAVILREDVPFDRKFTVVNAIKLFRLTGVTFQINGAGTAVAHTNIAGINALVAAAPADYELTINVTGFSASATNGSITIPCKYNS